MRKPLQKRVQISIPWHQYELLKYFVMGHEDQVEGEVYLAIEARLEKMGVTGLDQSLVSCGQKTVEEAVRGKR